MTNATYAANKTTSNAWMTMSARVYANACALGNQYGTMTPGERYERMRDAIRTAVAAGCDLDLCNACAENACRTFGLLWKEVD